MIGPLSCAVAQLCDDAGRHLSGPSAVSVAALRRRLGEPLRLAVAGRVKAGKSTLVNALVGRHIAQTADTECTRVVTYFRYAPDERYEVVAQSSTTTAHRLPADGLPTEYPLPPEDIARVDVFLSSEPLRTCTIIDTPGLSSTNTRVNARTSELLGVDIDSDSAQAVGAAEAVLFVLNQNVRADERHVLDSLRALPLNSMAVLSKADLVAEASGRGGTDPWQAAQDLADNCAETLGGAVATVVPVAGLIAESVRAGRLVEADAAALRRLAELDPARLRLLMLSVQRFTTADAPVDTTTRQRLVERLGLYGIRRTLTVLAAGHTSSAQLFAELAKTSGFASLVEDIDALFRGRADAIKAATAMSALRSIATSPGLHPDEAEWLRDELEIVALHPAMHALEELDAADAVLAGRVELPDELAEEVTRFGARSQPADKLGHHDAPPRDLANVALAAARRWRGLANGLPPAQARIASVMHRGHHLLWEQLATDPSPATSTTTGS